MSEPRSASVKNARLRTSSTIAYLAEGTCGGQGLECAHNGYALMSTCVPVVGPCVVYGFGGGSRGWHLRDVIRWCGIRLSTCACCALEVYSILVVIVARLVCADLCCFPSTCCWFVLERFGEACCRFVALERGRYGIHLFIDACDCALRCVIFLAQGRQYLFCPAFTCL